MADTPTDPPFKYVGGELCLDLVNTSDWTRQGPVRERLGGYERLVQWSEEGGALSSRTARSLRRAARSRPDDAAAAHRRALELRSLLHALFRSLSGGRRSSALWEQLNERLTECLRHLRVEPDAGSGSAVAAWRWDRPEDHLDSPLWPVLRSAAELLTSDEACRIRACDGPECGWMYVDRSRNHLRRWCEMETCGTDAKTRRRRERSRRRATAGSA